MLIAPNGGEERIEFLCAGQQCVLHGIHPDTQKPYRWHGIPLWDIDRGELAGITAEQALALLNAIVELLISKFGYRRKDALVAHARPVTAITAETIATANGGTVAFYWQTSSSDAPSGTSPFTPASNSATRGYPDGPFPV